MPTGNQNQGRRNGGNDRSNGGLRQPAGQLKEGAADLTNRLQEGYSAVRDQVGERYEQAGQVVAGNPATAVLVGLGLGFGLGIVLSTILTQREETWAERNLPNSLLGLPDQVRRSHFADTLRHAPEALHGRFDHLTDTLRDLPAAIARAIPKH